jgi:hypothetical protein
MNSSHRRCASSTRSSNGSFFASEKKFAKDIDSVYGVLSRAQAGIFRLRHSLFPILNSQFLP